MFIKEVVDKIEGSEAFKKFQKEHPEFYLVHLFYLEPDESWQVGYYSKTSDKIVVFSGDPVTVSEEDDPFKKHGAVHALDLPAVKIDFDKAMELVEEARQKEHSAELVNKKIVILQYIEQVVWNITLISAQFNLINVRVDAVTGDVLRVKKESIMSLGK